MALNSNDCTEVPLRNYSFIESLGLCEFPCLNIHSNNNPSFNG